MYLKTSLFIPENLNYLPIRQELLAKNTFTRKIARTAP